MSRALDVAEVFPQVVVVLLLGAVGIVMGQRLIDPVTTTHKRMKETRSAAAAGTQFGTFLTRNLCVREEKQISRTEYACPDRATLDVAEGTNPTSLLGPKDNNNPNNVIDSEASSMYCMGSTTGTVSVSFSKAVVVKLVRVRQSRVDPKKRVASVMKRMKVSWDGSEAGESEIVFDAKTAAGNLITGEVYVGKSASKLTFAPVELSTTYNYFPVCISGIEVVGKMPPDLVIDPEATSLLGLGFRGK